MAKYKVLKNSFIDGVLYEPGAIVEFSGIAGEYLQPVGDGPHNVEPRRFDLTGGEKLSVLQRAEIASSTGAVKPRADSPFSAERAAAEWNAK